MLARRTEEGETIPARSKSTRPRSDPPSNSNTDQDSSSSVTCHSGSDVHHSLLRVVGRAQTCEAGEEANNVPLCTESGSEPLTGKSMVVLLMPHSSSFLCKRWERRPVNSPPSAGAPLVHGKEELIDIRGGSRPDNFKKPMANPTNHIQGGIPSIIGELTNRRREETSPSPG